jgi:BirA family biotin operon repressor/biotin-[acetyl-CoA-carboxylase] ligase
VTDITPLVVHRLDVVDSTNDYLLRLEPVRGDRFTVAVARSQSAGRGRSGRPFLAEKDAALLVSIRWPTWVERLDPESLVFCAGACAALAGLDAARAVIGRGGRGESQGREVSALDRYPSVGLKWPNDLMGSGRARSAGKVGGVLVESHPSRRDPRTRAVVTGIGLNVNSAPALEGDYRAISLAELVAVGSRSPDAHLARIETAFEAFLEAFLARAELVAATGGIPDEILREYRQECWTVGQEVSLYLGGGPGRARASRLTGRAVGVDSVGRLLVLSVEGSLSAVAIGEVGVRPKNPAGAQG